MGNKISSTQKKAYLPFIKANLGKIPMREIARRLGIGNTTVRKWAAELGFKHRKHMVNESFFDEFSENSIYLLGLIYADGNIAWNSKKGYQALTITAAAKDKNHLEKLRNLLSSTKPLLFAPTTNSYRLIVNNKKMCLRLIELGVTPRKSLTIQFPKFISKKFLPHFLRGVIDGDGHVRYLKRKRSPYFEITLASGSKQFCEGFVKSVKDNFGIDTNIRKVHQNTYQLQYSCSRGKNLARIIYSNATLFLERKYLPYKENVLEVEENDK